MFAVADGMGGHQAGEVASGIAIDQLEAAADRTPTPGLDEVVATIEASNAAIRSEALSRAELIGMGTTCTVVVVDAASTSPTSATAAPTAFGTASSSS